METQLALKFVLPPYTAKRVNIEDLYMYVTLCMAVYKARDYIMGDTSLFVSEK